MAWRSALALGAMPRGVRRGHGERSAACRSNGYTPRSPAARLGGAAAPRVRKPRTGHCRPTDPSPSACRCSWSCGSASAPAGDRPAHPTRTGIVLASVEPAHSTVRRHHAGASSAFAVDEDPVGPVVRTTYEMPGDRQMAPDDRHGARLATVLVRRAYPAALRCRGEPPHQNPLFRAWAAPCRRQHGNCSTPIKSWRITPRYRRVRYDDRATGTGSHRYREPQLRPWPGPVAVPGHASPGVRSRGSCGPGYMGFPSTPPSVGRGEPLGRGELGGYQRRCGTPATG